MMQLEVGSPAPPFTLLGPAGREVALAGSLGRKAVIFFYPKDDTSGCTQEAREFNALRGEFEAAGTDVIGVSPDGAASHAKFAKKHELELTLASDEGKITFGQYGVWVEKSMYGRRYMGVERTTILVDPEGKIARIWRKVKVPGHAAEVLAAAKVL